jgi:hypothetical protein
MSDAVDILNPSAERFYLYTQVLFNSGTSNQDVQRIYFNHTPQIETGQMVGLSMACMSLFPLAGPPQNISPLFNGVYANLIYGALDVYVTIVNTNNEILFQNIPWSSLYPYDGKIHKYNAVNIDTRKSYFSLAAGTFLPGDITINLIFLMNYQ